MYETDDEIILVSVIHINKIIKYLELIYICTCVCTAVKIYF